MKTMTNGQGHETMEQRLARIGSRIDGLMSKIQDRGTDSNQHVHGLMEDLYSSVDRELKRIERRIQSTSNKVDDDVLKTRSDLLESVREELAVWRGRLEGLHLQASLGRMDADEKLRPTIKRLESSYDTARKHLHDLSRDEMSWDEIEPLLTAAMKDLRHEFDVAGSEYTIA